MSRLKKSLNGENRLHTRWRHGNLGLGNCDSGMLSAPRWRSCISALALGAHLPHCLFCRRKISFRHDHPDRRPMVAHRGRSVSGDARGHRRGTVIRVSGNLHLRGGTAWPAVSRGVGARATARRASAAAAGRLRLDGFAASFLGNFAGRRRRSAVVQSGDLDAILVPQSSQAAGVRRTGGVCRRLQHRPRIRRRRRRFRLARPGFQSDRPAGGATGRLL